MTQPKMMDGIFAITKPTGISSAQVIRDMQEQFGPSKLFAPWLEAEKKRRSRENSNQRYRRRDKGPVRVKIGHGGTLDPLATGVLITGIGTGTKGLSKFLECTKTYEAVLLFGASTDSHDRLGKILEKASYNHITRAAIASALESFRGDIMQKPPIYSALKVQGKKMYEYAREGKALPIEIVPRPVTVSELSIMDYMDGGTHPYKFPEDLADTETRETAKAMQKQIEDIPSASKDGLVDEASSTETGKKRKRSVDTENSEVGGSKSARLEKSAVVEPAKDGEFEHDTQVNETNEETPSPSANDGSMAPAVKLRMTVSSGFYVRSLCHDLGKALGSLAFMTELSRSRQGEYELGKNVFDYDDLKRGEDIWGPKVEKMILGEQATAVVEDKTREESTATAANETTASSQDQKDQTL